MDGRNLGCFSEVLIASVSALVSVMGNGVLATNVLQSIILGTLADLLPKLGLVSGNGAAEGLLGMEQAIEIMKHGKAGKKTGGIQLLGP
ncbi:hypothetical protein DCAR_0310118 [Daucus carota subsp. sativus]|uniref:Uncharacterized protein n=1 Tax=Daucus carota subsp. sativus TaxID=79200 RepID=A0A165ZLV0_DAUCS|nr:hypothetical protein DCAR_0310118 [Daucus carota subsp. sativus]